MRHYILALLAIIASLTLTSCGNNSDLYKATDYFVDELSSTYQSYGLQGLSHKKVTNDDKYSVTPVGRLIIVKIEDYVSSDEYEKLQKKLEKHYNKDSRVNKVYINQGGTVVIDCRN